MEFVVLGLLLLKSQTIYEMNKAFQQGIALFYSASYGSLQTALKKLLNQGLIEFVEQTEQGRHKKVYVITESGKQAFWEWMEAELPTSRMESVALAKVFFLGLITDNGQKRAIIEGIIAKLEEETAGLEQMDSGLRQMNIPEAYQNIFTYQLKTLDYGVQTQRFAKKWFQSLLAELSEDKG